MSASNAIPYDTNVSNFVSVKLWGKDNYFLWKAQMLCLLNSINVCGILDGTFVGPRDSGLQIVRQYDNLVKGWIFGSVSEKVLRDVYDLDSAKAVWEKLRSNYDPTSLQDDLTSQKSDAKTEKEDIDACSDEEGTNSATPHTLDEGAITIKVTETKNDDTQSSGNKTERRNKLKKLKSLIINGDWPKLKSMLKDDKGLVTEAINSDGSTILHIAVGIHHNYIVNKLLWQSMSSSEVLKRRESDGSTTLHIAAIVGNIDAARLLVEKNSELLLIRDNNGDHPSQKAYKNMHLDTIAYLSKSINSKLSSASSLVPVDESAYRNVIVNAISSKQYSLASEFMHINPKAASESDEVLMALAKTYPSGLDDGESLFYPSLKNILKLLYQTALVTAYLFAYPAIVISRSSTNNPFDRKEDGIFLYVLFVVCLIMLVIPTVPICMLAVVFAFICLLILIVCFPFLLLYYLLWKGANILSFPPITKIENKIIEQEEARQFLLLVCDEIDKLNYSGTHHPHYTRPILEAACRNAYDVVDEILSRSPEAIQSKDKSGYDIIQLAIINRSEKIYNLIYVDVDERKNLHKMYEDSSKNNILHMVGKLAPSNVLNRRTGAALQLQRELQWREEVKKLVIPTYIDKENIFKETPDMVFTREHEDLLKKGEQWMKTTSESCSITAALIITIVFAAAITVPGGSNQENGIPVFRKEVAFHIFAISDAISLFASSTALLVFLSILTARFAEKDFLVSLPWRLFIGLFSLLLSTTTMMVAFSATLFLVFCDNKPWMLAPICGLAFIPIAFFIGLQFPLMVDLFSSTYIPIFGKERKATSNTLVWKTYESMLNFLGL